MKIVDLKTYIVGNPPPHRGGINWVFLKITTDNGVEGIGEVFKVPVRPPTAVSLIEDMGEQFIIGADPFKIERLWRLLFSSGYATFKPNEGTRTLEVSRNLLGDDVHPFRGGLPSGET